MKEEENILEFSNMDHDPPFTVTSENTTQKASGSKVAPPVAPRPAWFRPSLKKILDNQNQWKQTNLSAGIIRSYGGRSTAGAVNMSIKQKIHSFEMFSSLEAQDKRASIRSTPLSNSLALIEKDSASPCHSYPASDKDDGKSKQDFPQVIQSDQSTPVVNENISDPPSGITSTTYNDYCQTKAKSSEDHLSCNETSINIPPSDTISTENYLVIDDANLASDPTNSTFQPSKQESELEKVDISRSTEISVQPCASSVRINQEEAVNDSDVSSRNDSGELLRTAQNASPTTEGQLQKSRDEEHFGKIIAFSNQVSQAIMRSLPTSNDGNPHFQNFPDTPLKDVGNPQESEMHRICTNKAFSVSLATLSECTIEQSGGSFDRASCIHSVISVIPSQEIQKMTEEIKALDEETLKQLADIHVVILHKDVGAGLGFSIAGGCDLENKAPTVHKVFPCGLAAQEGTIQKGDEVLSINGLTLRGAKHMDATAVLRQARNQNLAVVVICKRTDEEGKGGGNGRGEEVSVPTGEQEAPLSVDVEKGAGGIGFSLEGGRGSIQGDRPLVINRIFKGGAAEQSGLRCGDELLQVMGVSLHDMTRFEAWNMIKALPEGSVTLVIRRAQVAKA
ncbi:pro-interleukin-16 isoform X3 [Girardinichthys multiradiatus]|uniref:pro-interleukin-16 isoform X3 n=1 Tax=Girardinichthys multiradiatus TaxID=208333 RepID=UPI001FAC3043|nr:pro-interleukin-16 isoform X3 [Girardinichthys multiradiatus]